MNIQKQQNRKVNKGLFLYYNYGIMRNMKKKFRKYEEGWSFVETLIVMAIVLILTAAVGFSAIKQVEKARVVTARSQIETFSLALDSYQKLFLLVFFA